MVLCTLLLVVITMKNDAFYRVSYTYFLKSIGFEGRYTHDFKSLDNAIEYMNNRKSKEAGKDFTIEKVVTTYEVIASG